MGRRKPKRPTSKRHKICQFLGHLSRVRAPNNDIFIDPESPVPADDAMFMDIIEPLNDDDNICDNLSNDMNLTRAAAADELLFNNVIAAAAASNQGCQGPLNPLKGHKGSFNPLNKGQFQRIQRISTVFKGFLLYYFFFHLKIHSNVY
ncbi:unnamed protein product [Meganyctiphanes norvegica]|uniref:Uncharacterized protein n=1 Tax=Meganyctiphanes norvegica TaxID=48144 RepID=A0AAV2QBM7_MEGNR